MPEKSLIEEAKRLLSCRNRDDSIWIRQVQDWLKRYEARPEVVVKVLGANAVHWWVCKELGVESMGVFATKSEAIANAQRVLGGLGVKFKFEEPHDGNA